MENKHVGYLVVGISLLMGFIIYSFNKALTDMVSTSCSHGESCPMWGTLEFQTNTSLALMGVIIAIGLYLIFFSDRGTVRLKKKVFRPEGLEGDEKKVFQAVADSDGSILQSELAQNTGMTKVKTTRVLDRLEGKGMVERKRRGMTNIVILRH